MFTKPMDITISAWIQGLIALVMTCDKASDQCKYAQTLQSPVNIAMILQYSVVSSLWIAPVVHSLS